MKKIRKIGLIALTLIVIVGTIGFAAGGRQQQQPDVYRIGVSLPPILNDFHAAMRRYIEDTIANAPPNFDFTVVSALNAGDQVNVLETFLIQNFDGVLISPMDGTLITPIVEEIYRTGTKVVIVNRNVETANITSFVSGDNPGGARNAANYIGRLLNGQGTVFLGRLLVGTPMDIDRTYPFIDELQRNWPGIRVLGHAEFGNNREGGFNGMMHAMQAHPVINAVYCSSEIAAIGAALAVQQAGRNDVRISIGFGASRALVNHMDEDPNFLVSATISYSARMGQTAVNTLLDAVRGVPVPKEVLDPSPILTIQDLPNWRNMAH